MDYEAKAYYPYTKLVPTDIYPVQYGEHQCMSDYSFGPCIRSNYLLHYVYSGGGVLRMGGVEYRVESGQMFLIVPGRSAYYKADAENPWLYRWIEFNGTMADRILSAAELSEAFPVYTDDEKRSVGKVLYELVKGGDMPYENVMAQLWLFIASLSKKESLPEHDYISRAEGFIKINLHKKITVADIAAHTGIDRSYLCRLFREHRGMSPQQYLLSTKMNTAAQYLKDSDVTVSEAAQSVGYSDTHVFNKAFRMQFGTSPTAWRKKQQWDKYIIKDEL